MSVGNSKPPIDKVSADSDPTPTQDHLTYKDAGSKDLTPDETLQKRMRSGYSELQAATQKRTGKDDYSAYHERTDKDVQGSQNFMSKTSMSMRNELGAASQGKEVLSDNRTDFNATSEDNFSRRMADNQFQSVGEQA